MPTLVRCASVLLALSMTSGCGGRSKTVATSECEELSQRFARTLAEAKRCDPAMPIEPCSTKMGSDLACGAPTWVADDVALQAILDDWWSAGCPKEATCPEYGDKPRRGECSNEGACVDRND